ncbi:unnamed protein product [Spodoptera littoralis]|uniref:Gamma-glutamyltransferase n=1 Tax=Spodoptera littoralis TaxID=7109 RepID=A0A9P0IEY1_SPOLI|nr:unnamed protein product [Spodoptera littoralis]CAH1644621.1 unnamed protein product [Spodoptera littoralis]
MASSSRSSPDSQHVTGAALREDLPLKAGSGVRARCCAPGPRLILTAFAVLSAAITLALVTQIYYGDFELVPHGSVSSSAAACSRAGTDALKAGGRALDAAAAAALCLAVLAPHRTSLDASGAMLYWEYRAARTRPPTLYEWGGASEAGRQGAAGRPPRLVLALATLHAQLGALPWQQLLMPAIRLAKEGYQVSEGLAAAAGAADSTLATGTMAAGSLVTAPALAAFLSSLLANTSSELTEAWHGAALVRSSTPVEARAGSWRVLTPPGAAGAARALQAALLPAPASPDEAQSRVIAALQVESRAGQLRADGPATGLAAVDQYDTYIALVTGLSAPFGSGPVVEGGAPDGSGWALKGVGWTLDEPHAQLDLAPAIMLDTTVCGTRYVLGAESTSALAQAGAALVVDGAAGAVERARVALRPAGLLALEAGRAPPPAAALPAPPAYNATPPHAAVNLVQQRADALASHADSRGGGLASRF